jgi:hypothetical protein
LSESKENIYFNRWGGTDRSLSPLERRKKFQKREETLPTEVEE